MASEPKVCTKKKIKAENRSKSEEKNKEGKDMREHETQALTNLTGMSQGTEGLWS